MMNVMTERVRWDAEAILDAVPERVVRYRIDDFAITYCNVAWCQSYGVEREQAIGRPLDTFLTVDGRDGLRTQLRILGPDRPVATDPTARSTSGHPDLWLEWVDRYMVGPDGPEVLSVGRDVTARRDAELRLAASEARFRNLADHSSDIVWRLATVPVPHFDYISPSFERVTGYPTELLTDHFESIFDIVDEASRRAVEISLRGEHEFVEVDLSFRRPDGSIVILETRATRISDGVQGVSRDVTEFLRLQARLTELASLDPLTGLPNRRRLAELFEELLDRADGCATAVAYVDLDGLKEINDLYGHEAGDTILCGVARRLSDATGPDDIVARIGGDEFVVVFDGASDRTDELVARIHDALREPIELDDGTPIVAHASVGISHSDDVGDNASQLLAVADQAMYENKRRRRLSTTVPTRRAAQTRRAVELTAGSGG